MQKKHQEKGRKGEGRSEEQIEKGKKTKNGLQRVGREKINLGGNDGEMSVRGGET